MSCYCLVCSWEYNVFEAHDALYLVPAGAVCGAGLAARHRQVGGTGIGHRAGGRGRRGLRQEQALVIVLLRLSTVCSRTCSLSFSNVSAAHLQRNTVGLVSKKVNSYRPMPFYPWKTLVPLIKKKWTDHVQHALHWDLCMFFFWKWKRI